MQELFRVNLPWPALLLCSALLGFRWQLHDSLFFFFPAISSVSSPPFQIQVSSFDRLSFSLSSYLFVKWWARIRLRGEESKATQELTEREGGWVTALFFWKRNKIGVRGLLWHKGEKSSYYNQFKSKNKRVLLRVMRTRMRDILQLRPDYETAGLEFRSRFSASGLSLKPIQKEAVLEKKQQPYKKHMARMRDHHSTEIMFVTLALPAQFNFFFQMYSSACC